MASPPAGIGILALDEEGLSARLLLPEEEQSQQTHSPLLCGPADAGQHPLVSWFEREVRQELAEISKKLDNLMAGEGGAKFKKRRVPSLQQLEAGSEQEESVAMEAKFGALRRAMSTLSCMSGPNSEEMPTTALGAVLGLAPDNARLEKMTGGMGSRSMTGELIQVMPGSASNSSNNFGGVEGVHGRRRSSIGGRPSSLSSEKQVVKAAFLSRFQRRGLRIFERVWTALEDPDSSKAARWCAIVMPMYIIFTVFVTLLQVLSPQTLHAVVAAAVETTVDCVFLLEFLVRLVVCPNHRTFWYSIFNLIDLVAAAPLVFRACIGFVLPQGEISSFEMGFLLCAVPIIRILKLLRRFEKLHLLLKAFEQVAEALPVLMFMLFVIDLVFSMLLFLVEPRENIPSFATAVWLTTVTMTTVGYGDITPTSAGGSVITGILVVITLLYMAIPLGIIGNAFTITWNERHRLLLMARTRDRLNQWGYTAHDIPVLFNLSDINDDGELDVHEFRDLLQSMNFGFSDERIFDLFRSFDQDNSGTIDDREFIRALFPDSYHDIFRDDRKA
uniref:EF-hand domain-containing protein n=1 Tax=Alexandrium monilatum TaxID=311494 RepID=A0A7S4PV31_9DINO